MICVIPRNFPGTGPMAVPFVIDWVEVPTSAILFKPELPNLSQKLYLPDVASLN